MRTGHPLEGLVLGEIFANAHESLRRLDQHVASPTHHNEYVPGPRLEWYSARHREVAALLRWLDTEAAGVVGALVEAETDHPEPMFAALEIPQLQEHLVDVKEAYAAEVALLEKDEGAQAARQAPPT